MNAKQLEAFEKAKRRVVEHLGHAFEDHLTQQLVSMKLSGVDKDTRRQFEHAAIVWFRETEHEALRWLERQVLMSADVSDCEVRIRREVSDDIRETIDQPPLHKH